MPKPAKKDCERVLARWSCARDGCNARWTSNTWILSEKCGNPVEELTKNDYIIQGCRNCGNRDSLLTSYPAVIQRLVWKNWYRVFGTWACGHCNQNWFSSFTWVRLQKYKSMIPAQYLDSRDYYNQSCKACGSNNNDLLDYRHLGGQYGIKKKKPHMSSLC